MNKTVLNNKIKTLSRVSTSYDKHYFLHRHNLFLRRTTILTLVVVALLFGIGVLLYINITPMTVNVIQPKETVIPTEIVSEHVTSTTEPTPAEFVKYTTASIKFRQRPDTRSVSYMVIPLGSRVVFKQLQKIGDFLYLEYKGEQGYVMEKYLSDEQYQEAEYMEQYMSINATSLKNSPHGQVVAELGKDELLKVNPSKTEGMYIHVYCPKENVFGWVDFNALKR